MSEPSQAPVQFRTIPTDSGHAIGVATLDTPSTLNALSLDIINALNAQLAAWEDAPEIAAVWLDASSEKAFCAGGDLQRLYASMKESGEGTNAYAQEFFAQEYRLDYRVHSYTKPIVVWMHGIVMGGGMGLACGAAHRVVTEGSMLAMPEITVGLFPDVGGSWFLSRMPGGLGKYVALTGARLNAADAIFSGLADLPLPQASKDEVLNSLSSVPWTGRTTQDNALMRSQLNQATDWSLAQDSALAAHFFDLAQIGAAADLPSAADAIAALATRDEWAAPHAKAFAKGAPSSLLLSWTMQDKLARSSLAEVLQSEYAAALGCCAHGDFQEGVRALIIDKDRNPQWKPATLDAADDELLAKLTRPRWSGAHPLADLS